MCCVVAVAAAAAHVLNLLFCLDCFYLFFPTYRHILLTHICFFIFRLCSFEFSVDEMLESEKSSLFGRVHDLERRVLTQQDEIVCLRSTLADVLRRLNTIEGSIERGAISNNTLNIQGGRSAPNTPSRNGAPVFNRCKYELMIFFFF